MKHLKVGDQAPEFSSKNQDGEEVSLKDFKGMRVALYFYPKDNTPGCTNQACDIRDNYGEILKNGIVILGVSADTQGMHQKFIRKYDLPFPLLADKEKELINLYGVWGEKKFMGKIYDGIHRTTFLMDESHKIVGIIEQPKTKDHAREIVEIFNNN